MKRTRICPHCGKVFVIPRSEVERIAAKGGQCRRFCTRRSCYLSRQQARKQRERDRYHNPTVAPPKTRLVGNAAVTEAFCAANLQDLSGDAFVRAVNSITHDQTAVYVGVGTPSSKPDLLGFEDREGDRRKPA